MADDNKTPGMEKRGVIEPGRTPPEPPAKAKQAAADPYDHPLGRLADAAKDSISDNRNSH